MNNIYIFDAYIIKAINYKNIPPTMNRNNILLLITGLIIFIYSLASGVIFFVIPNKAEALFQNYALIGALIAIPNLFSLLFDVPIGGFVNKLGKKRILLTGLVSMVLLGPFLPAVNSITPFIIFMLILGLMNQFILISSRSYVIDISPEKNTSRSFGIYEAFLAFGFTLAPLTAPLLMTGDLQSTDSNIGIFYSVICLIALSLGLLLVEKRKIDKKAEKEPILKGIRDFKSLKTIGIVVLSVTFLMTCIDGMIWAFEPLFLTMNIPAETVGLILVMFVLPFALFETPAGILADKYGKKNMLVLGLLTAGLFMLLFSQEHNPDNLIILAFLSAASASLVRPSISGILADNSKEMETGGIVGVWNVSEDLGYVIGPIIAGLVAEMYKDVTIPFFAFGAILIICAPMIFYGIHSEKIKKHLLNHLK